ncbi:unnamed protein product, partial [Mesorhabditis belari]|uniref:Little elongation complex subunit 2 C-terminal domain-containing protein n=1 Tax=Mesorhabditis belari TaxID=2138241 RepID=A0AAF3FFE3_9BILA
MEVPSNVCDELKAIIARSLKGEDVFHEMFGHRSLVCSECIRLKVLEKRNGEEWLWWDRPPPWYREKEVEEDKPSTSRLSKRQEVVGRSIPGDLTPEQYIEKLIREKGNQHTASGVIRREAEKLLGLTKPAALLKVKELFKKIAAEKDDVGEEKNDEPKAIKNKFERNEMPYVAILSHLNETGSAKYGDNLEELKAWDKKLAQERGEFQTEALPPPTIFNWVPPSARNFIMQRWKQRFSNLYASNFAQSFSKEPIFQISFDENGCDAAKSDLPTIESIVTPSTAKRTLARPLLQTLGPSCLSLDILKDRFALPTISFKTDEQLETELCLSSNTSIIMEASAILALCANEWMGCYRDYVIPIKVYNKYGAKGVQTIRYVGRPLPIGEVSRTAITRVFYKWMVKSKVARDKKTASVATRRSQYKKQKQIASEQKVDFNLDQSMCDEASIASQSDSIQEERLIIEESKSLEDGEVNVDAELGGFAHSTPITSPKKSTISPNKGNAGVLDLLLDEAATKVSGSASHIKEAEAQYTKICFGNGAMPILVRSRGGVVEEDGSSATFDVKVDYVPESGAMALSDEEFVYHYLKSLLSGTNKHVLFRIHPKSALILQMENMFFGNRSSWHHDDSKMKLVGSRTLHMCRIIDEISSLTPGDYLMVKDEQSLQLLPSCTADEIGKENLIELRSMENTLHMLDWKNVVMNIEDVYHGLDPHKVLQWQVITGRAPATFLPGDHKLKHLLPAEGKNKRKNFEPAGRGGSSSAKRARGRGPPQKKL